MDDFEKLVNMGFIPQRIQEVISVLEGRPLEEMVTWLIENPDLSDNDNNSLESAEAQASPGEFEDYFSEIREKDIAKDVASNTDLDTAAEYTVKSLYEENLNIKSELFSIVGKGDSSTPMQEDDSPTIVQEGMCSTINIKQEVPPEKDPEPKTFMDFESSSDLVFPSSSASGSAATSYQGIDKAEDITPNENTEMSDTFKCLECMKILRGDDLQTHALRTQHEQYEAVTDDYKPRSDEEKKEAVKKLENKIKERRALQAAEEKKAEIEKERQRRKQGQEICTARAKFLEQEIIREAELCRKEKLEKQRDRERAKADLKRDMEARRLANAEKERLKAATKDIKEPTEDIKKPTEDVNLQQKVYEKCKLQIRLTNGQTLQCEFGAKESLASVRLFIELNRTDGNGQFTIRQMYPRNVFTEDDMARPLSELGLCPNAVLIIQPKLQD